MICSTKMCLATLTVICFLILKSTGLMNTITTSGHHSSHDIILTGAAKDQRRNVLFLVADDMRPEIGAYLGPDFPSKIHPKMFTPNLDKLASKSLLLKRAYVQEALCSPSRTSLLTGRRPDTTHIYQIGPYFREVGGNFTTLPEYFKNNGYQTIGIGKIFHPGPASGYDDPVSWTEPYYHAPNEPYWDTHNRSWLAVPRSQREKRPLPDEQLAGHAVQWIRKLSEDQATNSIKPKPFFLAVGLRKPHLPFVFPEEFIQYYPSKAVRLPDNPYAPDGMPPVAWYNYPGLREYGDIKKLNASGALNTTLPKDVVLQLRRAYYSAVSYSDAMLGEVMNELQTQGLAGNTIISFWGDHGWQLGEHGEWCKQTNFELATHAPMMVHIPGMTDQGIVTEALTEFVDLFPTLVEAASLPQLPLCPAEGASNVTLCREGESLLPLVKNGSVKWKDRVFSQYPRGDHDDIMGYSMRTDKYRYTEWVHFQGQPLYRPDWTKSHGLELYDHVTDPEENVNVAHDNRYQVVVKELSDKLHQGWRAAIPREEQ